MRNILVVLIVLVLCQVSSATPYISNPVQYGNFIQGNYSNTEYPLNLWESPNYVWGVYNYTDINRTYYQSCIYSGNDTFSCDFVYNTNFTFHFQYSDVYSYANGTNYTSATLFVGENSSIIRFSRQPLATKESTVKSSNFSYLYLVLIFIIIIFFASFTIRDRRKYIWVK